MRRVRCGVCVCACMRARVSTRTSDTRCDVRESHLSRAAGPCARSRRANHRSVVRVFVSDQQHRGGHSTRRGQSLTTSTTHRTRARARDCCSTNMHTVRRWFERHDARVLVPSADVRVLGCSLPAQLQNRLRLRVSDCRLVRVIFAIARERVLSRHSRHSSAHDDGATVD
jgi:hypothetical protein